MNFRSVLSIVFLASISSPAVGREPPAICGEFRKLLEKRGGLVPYKLEVFPDREGIGRIPNIDIDGDGLNDEVRWSCPGSGSRIPADPCTLSINLTSGKKLDLVEPRFELMRYRLKVYAVADDIRADGIVGRGKIYRVDGSGVKLICSQF